MGRAIYARAVCARRPLQRARKEFMSRDYGDERFGVDAVLPADVGGAPSTNRQHTKV